MTPHQTNRAAAELLRRLRVKPERRPPSTMTIAYREIERVCRALNVSIADVQGNGQYRNLCYARAIIAYNLRKSTTLTLDDVGRALHRTHATVVNSVRIYKNLTAIKDRVFLEMIRKANGTERT